MGFPQIIIKLNLKDFAKLVNQSLLYVKVRLSIFTKHITTTQSYNKKNRYTNANYQQFAFCRVNVL